MEKKEYIQPQCKAFAIDTNNILAGSLTVGGGSTTEQLSKSSGTAFEDEDEDY